MRQYVNGSLLASKDPLILESARAPRHHAVGWFVCSYASVMSRGMLFASRGGLILDSASAMRSQHERGRIHVKGTRSYHPPFCTVAQTGQVLDVWHRPGNVHDSSGARAFMLTCIREIRQILPT